MLARQSVRGGETYPWKRRQAKVIIHRLPVNRIETDGIIPDHDFVVGFNLRDWIVIAELILPFPRHGKGLLHLWY